MGVLTPSRVLVFGIICKRVNILTMVVDKVTELMLLGMGGNRTLCLDYHVLEIICHCCGLFLCSNLWSHYGMEKQAHHVHLEVCALFGFATFVLLFLRVEFFHTSSRPLFLFVGDMAFIHGSWIFTRPSTIPLMGKPYKYIRTITSVYTCLVEL